MNLKSSPRRRLSLLSATIVVLGFTVFFTSGCILEPHAFFWDGRTVSELPNSLGGTESEATDINSWDWVVGWANDGSLNRAVMWKKGVMQPLPSLWGGASEAAALNDLGQAVGNELDAGGHAHAILWSNGRAIDLAKSTWVESQATDISNTGLVVGIFKCDPSGDPRPFSWQLGRGIEIPVGAGTAYAVSALGTVGGDLLQGTNKPWLFRAGRSTMLPTLGGDGGSVTDVNGRGLAVGSASVTPGWLFPDTHAVTWRSGRITDLGVPAGYDRSGAEGVNLCGDVVGTATDALYLFPKAAVWRNGHVRLIPSLGDGTLSNYANAINIKGHVVGASAVDFFPSPTASIEPLESVQAPTVSGDVSGGRATVSLFDGAGTLIAELGDATDPAVQSADDLLALLGRAPYSSASRIELRLEWDTGGTPHTAQWVYLWQDGQLKTPDGTAVVGP